MPQKKMTARGQPPAKVAKAPGLKKAPVKKPTKATTVRAAKEARPETKIQQAKAALKKESSTSAGKSTAKMAPEAPQIPAKAKAEGKRSRKISIEIHPHEAASALAGKWTTLYKKAEQIEAKPYNMRNVFEEKTAITHKVLGWGYILANRNDRLEVLFKDGIKYLISNYKP